MATHTPAFPKPPLSSAPVRQSLEEVPHAATTKKNTKFRQFRSDLAALYLLPPEELERRWLEVKRKNEGNFARALQINPYDR